jgi:hypothetical protein
LSYSPDADLPQAFIQTAQKIYENIQSGALDLNNEVLFNLIAYSILRSWNLANHHWVFCDFSKSASRSARLPPPQALHTATTRSIQPMVLLPLLLAVAAADVCFLVWFSQYTALARMLALSIFRTRHSIVYDELDGARNTHIKKCFG